LERFFKTLILLINQGVSLKEGIKKVRNLSEFSDGSIDKDEQKFERWKESVEIFLSKNINAEIVDKFHHVHARWPSNDWYKNICGELTAKNSFLISLKETIEKNPEIWEDTSKNIKVDNNITNNNQEKNKIEENNKKSKIFLSYSHENKETADRVDKFFISKGIQLTRDERDAPAYSNLEKFMDTIRDHDYVILLISDAYLKSVNCMYEVIQFIQERNYIDRTFPIIIDNEATIFDSSKHIKYIHFWQEKYKIFGDKIKALKYTGTSYLHKELDKIDKIQSNIGEFLNKISKLKCLPLEELENTDYKAILDKISKTVGVFQKEKKEVESEELKQKIIGCLYKWYLEGLERGITFEFNINEKINEWKISSKIIHTVIDEILDDGYIERSTFGHIILTKQGRLLARKEKLVHKYDNKQCGKGD